MRSSLSIGSAARSSTGAIENGPPQTLPSDPAAAATAAAAAAAPMPTRPTRGIPALTPDVTCAASVAYQYEGLGRIWQQVVACAARSTFTTQFPGHPERPTRSVCVPVATTRTPYSPMSTSGTSGAPSSSTSTLLDAAPGKYQGWGSGAKRNTVTLARSGGMGAEASGSSG